MSPTTRISATRLSLLALVVLGAALLLGCREETPDGPDGDLPPRPVEGPPRAYQLGFSSLPPELSDAGYEEAFDLAAQWGEVLLVQRPPSWPDFMPGAQLSERQKTLTESEREAARSRGLKLFIALDPFDPTARERLASVPPGYEGRTLADADLRHAFVTEAKYIALNYRPAYLALGMEVNATYERDPAQYDAFLDAYKEAYAAVKEASPETLVFVTFQYEQLLGVIPWEPSHAARWELIDRYQSQLDLFAITTYPSFAYSVARAVPNDYYRQIRDHTQLPVAFAASGYASAPSRDGVNSSTPVEQRRFLERLVGDADELRAALVVWFAGRDAAYLTAPPYDLVANLGLRDAQDEPKESWGVWETAAKRPYDPTAAAQVDDNVLPTGTPTPEPPPPEETEATSEG